MITEVAEISLALFAINLFEKQNKEIMETATSRKTINQFGIDLFVAALVMLISNVQIIELSGNGLNSR